MTNEHASLEKYTSHTLFERVAKGLCVRGELETEQTATYWPQVPLAIAAPLPLLLSCSTGGPEGPSPLLGAGSHCNSNCNSNWSVARGYIIFWHPPDSCGRLICIELNPSTCQGDIFDRMHLFLDWPLGRRSICYIHCKFIFTFIRLLILRLLLF